VRSREVSRPVVSETYAAMVTLGMSVGLKIVFLVQEKKMYAPVKRSAATINRSFFIGLPIDEILLKAKLIFY